MISSEARLLALREAKIAALFPNTKDAKSSWEWKCKSRIENENDKKNLRDILGRGLKL